MKVYLRYLLLFSLFSSLSEVGASGHDWPDSDTYDLPGLSLTAPVIPAALQCAVAYLLYKGAESLFY